MPSESNHSTTAANTHPFIRQIDHIAIRSDDPRTLYARFHDDLGLPAFVPVNQYPTLTSGSVVLGNMFLEFFHFGPPDAQATSSALSSQLYIFSLLPQLALSEVVPILRQRQLACSNVLPFFDTNQATPEPIWANVFLGDLFDSTLWQKIFLWSTRRQQRQTKAMQVSARGARWLKRIIEAAYPLGLPFFTEYYRDNDDDRRAADAERLRQAGGGALGLSHVAEIVVGVTPAAQRHWWRLLQPLQPDSQQRWGFDAGPRLRLVQAPRPHIQSLVLAVHNLEQARAALRQRQLLDATASTASALEFRLPEAPQLHFVVVQAQA